MEGSTTTSPSWGDSFQDLLFSAAKNELGINSPSQDLERQTDDRNIPDRVDASYGVGATDTKQSMGIKNPLVIAGASLLGLTTLFLLFKASK